MELPPEANAECWNQQEQHCAVHFCGDRKTDRDTKECSEPEECFLPVRSLCEQDEEEDRGIEHCATAMDEECVIEEVGKCEECCEERIPHKEKETQKEEWCREPSKESGEEAVHKEGEFCGEFSRMLCIEECGIIRITIKECFTCGNEEFPKWRMNLHVERSI